MSQDIVKALGVEVRRVCVVDNSFPSNTVNYRSVIYVDDLRAALEKMPVVEGKVTFFGSPDNPQAYTKFEVVDKPHCTHTARLVAIEEIKKEPVKVEVTKEQIAKAWDVMAKSNRNDEFNIFCKELGL